MSKPVLACTVGVPGAGKTTWARTLMGSVPVVNPDTFRWARFGDSTTRLNNSQTWAMIHSCCGGLLAYGYPLVILDSVSHTVEARSSIRENVRGEYDIWWIPFSISLAEAQQRLAARHHGDDNRADREQMMVTLDQVASEYMPVAPDECREGDLIVSPTSAVFACLSTEPISISGVTR